jgi:nucleoid-associated protein YgaU
MQGGDSEMKKATCFSMACMVFALIVIAGCQPKLAESPYGAREQRWEEFIKDTYPDWEPPQTVPPARPKRPALSDTAPPSIIAEDVVTDVAIDAEPVVDTNAVNPGAVKEVAPTSEFQTYTVQKGDTLWKIAHKFYGSGKDWRKIYKANQTILSNPDKVKAGSEIRIPAK